MQIAWMESKNQLADCSYKQHAASDSMHICAFCSIIYRERMERRREYETGQYLAQLVGCSALTYLPAFVSVLISIVCLFFLLHKGKQKMSRWMIAGYALVTLPGYDLSLYIANWLDDFIRINW